MMRSDDVIVAILGFVVFMLGWAIGAWSIHRKVRDRFY